MSLPEDLAVAFDIGTTTIAASLVDRRSGIRLAAAGSLNPQREFGADVVARLQAACASAANRQRLTHLLSAELERLATGLLHRHGVAGDALSAVALAGNPTMEHLLLGLPVESLAFPPYRPLFTDPVATTTGELGWNHSVSAFVFPLPGGFVGGDLVAFLYGCRGGDPGFPQPRLYLDLGTNGEIALVHGERIYATSAAAGPAFEGGNLACGMLALPGAISKVAIEGARIVIETIAGAPPAGICGTAVIEVVSELLRGGVIDPTGRLARPDEIDSNLANRLAEVGGEPAFILHREAGRTIYLSQTDIRQVQLAKAAISGGMEVLFAKSGIRREELGEVVLTGSFGVELQVESLKRIGVFTENMVKSARFARDGALTGVERALSDPAGSAAVASLARAIRVIPLSGTPTFEKIFIEQMNFPM